MSLSRPNDPAKKRRENIPDVPNKITPVEYPVYRPEPDPLVVTTPRHPDQPTKKKNKKQTHRIPRVISAFPI